MPKDAYFFKHDGNAQDDPKCMLLIDQMGMEGYGIFWGLIEKLRNETSYMLPLSVCNAFAKRWGTSKEKVETVIKNYGLFCVENDFFFSKRLLSNMNYKTETARKSANCRWDNANALQMKSKRKAVAMRNDAIREDKKREEKSVGIFFNETGTKVFFKDGSSQELGQMQEQRYKEGDYKPHYIVKGIIQ